MQLDAVEGLTLDNGKAASRGGRRRHYWVNSETVRKEACKLAIQHHYFSPEWFAEFKDCLHCDSSSSHEKVIRELCELLAGTETCKYCVKRCSDDCVLDWKGSD
jgi:hypothetical protein